MKVPIEAENKANLPKFEDCERNCIAQTPIFVRVPREYLLRPVFLPGEDADNRKSAPQKPFQRECAAELAKKQSMRFGLDIVRYETRPMFLGYSPGHRGGPAVIGIIGVEKGENSTGVP